MAAARAADRGAGAGIAHREALAVAKPLRPFEAQPRLPVSAEASSSLQPPVAPCGARRGGTIAVDLAARVEQHLIEPLALARGAKPEPDVAFDMLGIALERIAEAAAAVAEAHPRVALRDRGRVLRLLQVGALRLDL